MTRTVPALEDAVTVIYLTGQKEASKTTIMATAALVTETTTTVMADLVAVKTE